MSFKILVKTLIILAFVMACTVVSFGQASVKGVVLINKGGSEFVPVAGVKLTCFRTDVEEKCGSAVTGEDGTFEFANLPKEAKVGLGWSGPKIAPSYYSEFAVTEKRAKKLYVLVSEGDGAEAPEGQLRSSIIGSDLSDDEKAERTKVEIDNQQRFENLFDVTARNNLRERLMKEGNEAYNAGDFDTAIAKYTQGYESDVNFLGSAPTFLNNRSVALKRKAVVEYNAAAKSGDKNMISEKRTALAKGLMESVEMALRTIDLVSADKALDSPHAKANESNVEDAKRNIADSFRILGQLKVTFPADSEEEGKKGLDLQMKSLKHVPDDPGILGSLMLSMYNFALWGDESYFQKSLNYGNYYLKKAPKDHNRRAAVAQIVDLLKTDNKLKPQPIK